MLDMRVRKHANPLNCRIEYPKMQCEELFKKPDNPIQIDIGFATGEFIIELSKRNLDYNYIGLEVREPLVERLKKTIVNENLQNLALFYASSFNHLHILPDRMISHVYVFFPDPWFKKRHHKRRIINEKFLQEIQSKLADKNLFLFQTDVRELFQDTEELINRHSSFNIIKREEGVSSINDTGIPSEYETRMIERHQPIYRLHFSFQRSN